MSAQNVVIVESPAKAKTINKYLGSDYEVIASYGHVRDLVNKDGSVLPDDDFAMRWQLGERSEKNVRDIKKLVKGAKSLYLATDPDREGEAISWLSSALFLRNQNRHASPLRLRRQQQHHIRGQLFRILVSFKNPYAVTAILRTEKIIATAIAKKNNFCPISFTMRNQVQEM